MENRLSEIFQVLSLSLGEPSKKGEFFIWIFDKISRPAITEEENEPDFNPFLKYPKTYLNKLFSGNKNISKDNVKVFINRMDKEALADLIDDRMDSEKDILIEFLSKKGIKRLNHDNVAKEFANFFYKSLLEYAESTTKRSTFKEDIKPETLAQATNHSKNIYVSGSKLFIDDDFIDLPNPLTEEDLKEADTKYIHELLNSYADDLGVSSITKDKLETIPPKYKQNFKEQNRAFLSAEYIHRSMREVFSDFDSQFQILEQDLFDGIEATYHDEYESGYRRLLETIKKVSDIALSKSDLPSIRNLIGNLERKGILHIMVNEEKIKSWVDPYE